MSEFYQAIMEELEDANKAVLPCRSSEESNGDLTVSIGMTADETVINENLADIAHILIGGHTGTGKTSFVQTILSMLICEKSVSDVRLVIFDSKGIDYGIFNHSKQLLHPVITDFREIQSVYEMLLQENQRRINLISCSGVRDYKQYNTQCTHVSERMVDVFVVLDDFSAISYLKETESIMALLRDGRITGIHLIIVSSIISSKVISREIKACVPCKISFRLSSRAESQLLLDQAGAEKLNVPGEMIYKYMSDFNICECAFAQYENMERAIRSKQYEKPNIKSLGERAAMLFSATSFNMPPLSAKEHIETEKNDMLLDEAVSMVIQCGMASTGILQRKLNISYNRAAKLLDKMEKLGVIGPENGTKPRQVIMTKKQWDTRGGLEEGDLIELRDFPELRFGDISVGISDSRVKYSKPIMTKLGPGTITPEFSGRDITSIVYKKPTAYSDGFFTFGIKESVNIHYDEKYLDRIDNNNLSEVLTVKIGIEDDENIKQFLNWISEDTGIPITRI